MIYECTVVTDVYSGCTTFYEDTYIDLKNKHIYIYDKSKYQYYQLQNNNYYDDLNERYYHCDSRGFCKDNDTYCHYLSGTETPEGSGIYNGIIKCNKSSCVSLSYSEANGYFINCSDEGESLIKCSNNNSTLSCSVTVTTDTMKTIGYAYLDSGSDENTINTIGGVIVCLDNKCSSISKPTNDEIYYFIDADVDTNNNIIKCDKTECISFTATPTKGYAFIDGTTEGNVLLGNGSEFVPTASGATQNSNEYYIDASDPFKIITCYYDADNAKSICVSDITSSTGDENEYDISSNENSNENSITCEKVETTLAVDINNGEILKCEENENGFVNKL